MSPTNLARSNRYKQTTILDTTLAIGLLTVLQLVYLLTGTALLNAPLDSGLIVALGARLLFVHLSPAPVTPPATYQQTRLTALIMLGFVVTLFSVQLFAGIILINPALAAVLGLIALAFSMMSRAMRKELL